MWWAGMLAAAAAFLLVACTGSDTNGPGLQDGAGTPSLQSATATIERTGTATIGTPVPPVAAIEPRSDLDPGTLCNAQFAEAKVHALFAALNSGDAAAIEKMFPTTGSWLFGFSLGVPEIDRELRHVSPFESDTGPRNGTEMRLLLSKLSGVHFVFTSPLVGAADPEEGLASVGPVHWRASGALFRAIGKDFVNGGGKIGVDCTTGLFVRVLLDAERP